MKTILFDLGNVLLKFSHERMCEQIAELFESSVEEVKAVLFDQRSMLRFDRGELSAREFQQQLESALGKKSDLPSLQRAAGEIFTPNPGMRELLDELKQRGLRLVLLSNTCVTHINWIRANFDHLELLDDLVLSYEVGAVKPQREIFEVALQKIQCNPHECLYTDDILEYVEAARTYGLNAEQFTTPENFRATLREYSII